MIEKLVLASNLLFKYFGAISINYFVSFLLAVLNIFWQSWDNFSQRKGGPFPTERKIKLDSRGSQANDRNRICKARNSNAD